MHKDKECCYSFEFSKLKMEKDQICKFIIDNCIKNLSIIIKKPKSN